MAGDILTLSQPNSSGVVSARVGGRIMPEAPSGYQLIYQLRVFFARNPGRSFSVPQLRRKFGESVRYPLLSLSHEGYLNTVLKYGMPHYELAEP